MNLSVTYIENYLRRLFHIDSRGVGVIVDPHTLERDEFIQIIDYDFGLNRLIELEEVI